MRGQLKTYFAADPYNLDEKTISVSNNFDADAFYLDRNSVRAVISIWIYINCPLTVIRIKVIWIGNF